MNQMMAMPLTEKLNQLFTFAAEEYFDNYSFNCMGEMITIFHLKQDFIPQQIRQHNTFYEAEFLQTLSFFWDRQGAVFDIGANIGNHSLWFAKIMGAHVWAFEPIPMNALTHCINMEINHVQDRVRFFQIGLDKLDGELSMGMAKEGNMGTWSMLSGNAEDSVKVSVTPLDRLLEKTPLDLPISVIKIDVEGMEENVLHGAREALQRFKPVLAMESATLSELSSLETLISPWGYFPVEVMNYTPTFIWLNKYNPYHMEKLSEYVRRRTILKRQTRYA